MASWVQKVSAEGLPGGLLRENEEGRQTVWARPTRNALPWRPRLNPEGDLGNPGAPRSSVSIQSSGSRKASK